MNLKYILYVIFIIHSNRTFAETNGDILISEKGVEGVTPCGIGLKFFVELNNTSDKHDYEVQVSADQCCLEADGSLDCDVLEIIGDCVGFVPRGAIKTVRMVAPILDPIERRGYCILYLDSKCNYNGRNMRDTIKINFDTRLGNINEILKANIKPCKNIDEDPLNDCRPVDCDTYYNNRKPHYSKKFKRCVETPPCFSNIESDLPNAIYDPVSNLCVKGKSINKRDIDYIKDLNAKNRRDVLIIRDFNNDTDDNITNFNHLNNAVDMVPLCKECNKLHVLNPPIISPLIKNSKFPINYLVTNKYILGIFAGVIVFQCILIGAIIYCFTNSCACCKQKKVIRKFFNYRQDASVTTPLIGTSNIDTETDYQFESESSNVDKKIKCYKACQKERNRNMKMSMSDDILSKCLNRRNWSRHQNKSEAIPELTNEIPSNIDKVEPSSKIKRTDSKKLSETKVAFEDEKPKISEKLSKRVRSIPKCLNKEIIEREREEVEEHESSEREIQCHSYNDNSSNITGFKPRTDSKNLGYMKTEKMDTVSMSSDKEAQACFSNDSIDDFLSERGIYFAENISKYNFSTDTNKTSTPTPVSSKTSKNNFVKSVLSLLRKKSKTNASDPGRKVKENDVKLIHMSRATINTSSNDSEYVKCIEPKDSRVSRTSL